MLAPYHTGSQLVKMPKREFIDRCLATIDVNSVEQAEAFYAKLWKLHIDSKYADGVAIAANDIISRSSAAPGDVRVNFKERIRPGMVLRHRIAGSAGNELALVLSQVPDQQSFLCSAISKADYKEGYELNVWHQRAVQMEDMIEEVIMEYDPATRYYFLVI
jgi:kinesin family member 2/24